MSKDDEIDGKPAPRPPGSRAPAPDRRAALRDEKRPPDDEEDDDEDEDEEDGDEEDDDDGGLAEYTATEAAGAFRTVFGFVAPYLSRHRKGVALVSIGLLVEMAFNVLMPLSLKYLIDEAFEEKDREHLVFILTVLGVAGLLTSIVAIWYEWQDAKVTSEVTADVRKTLFDHLQQLPISFYARARRGEVLSRFSNDMVTFEEAIINLANWGVLPLLELGAGIVLLYFLNWQLALVASLVFPLVLIGPKLLTPRAVTASYELKRAQSAELGVVHENVGAQTVVKAFELQHVAKRWFVGRNIVLRQAQRRSTFLNTMVERSITITVLWLHLVVLAIGAYLTFNDVITIGTFVAFESVFWEITYNLNHLTQYIPVVIDASGATRHMKELLDEPIRIVDRPGAVELPRIAEAIAFENVSFGYGGGPRLLNGFNMAIPAGKRVAVVGPSGAGKSTILNLILRLYDPTAGRIAIDGTDIAGVTRGSLRGQMAVVFQENVLFNTTFRENIRLGNPEATDAQIVAAAKAAEIHKFIAGLPRGYDTMVGERGDTMSGGQRQRIAIARALVRDPAILLLDEATSALDQTTEAAINRTLKRIAGGRTVIFITHRLTSVTDMDEIIVLNGGKVAQRGKHAELLTQRGLYRKLWDDQMKASAGEDEDE